VGNNTDFDVLLDDRLGYININDPQYQRQFMPGTGSLTKRGWFDDVVGAVGGAVSRISIRKQY
jgi:hypothetical protein